MSPKCKCNSISFETSIIKVKHGNESFDMVTIICSECGDIIYIFDRDTITNVSNCSNGIIIAINNVLHELKKITKSSNQ